MARRLSAELSFILRFDPEFSDLDDPDDDAWAWYRNVEWTSDAVDALARHLGFPLAVTRDDAAWVLLDGLLEQIEGVLREGSPKGKETRGRSIVQSLVGSLKIGDLLRVMGAFGWDRERVDDVQLRRLTAHVRGMLADRLEPAITSMLERWNEQGLLELKQRRRRQPSYRADARREHSQRLYEPPPRF